MKATENSYGCTNRTPRHPALESAGRANNSNQFLQLIFFLFSAASARPFPQVEIIGVLVESFDNILGILIAPSLCQASL